MSGYPYRFFIFQIYWRIFMKPKSGFIEYHNLHYITLAFIYMVLHFRRLMMFWFMQPLWKLMASPMIPVYWSCWPLNTVAWPISDDNSCHNTRDLVWGICKFLIIVARWQSGSDRWCPELFDIQLCPHIDRHSWMAWGQGMLAGLSSHVELLAHSSYISYVGKTNILTSNDVLGLFDSYYLFLYQSAVFATWIHNMDVYASYTFYMVFKRSAKL